MVNELKRRASPMKVAILAVTASNAIEAYYLAALGTEPLAIFGTLLPLLLGFDAIGIGLGAGASSVYARLHRAPRCKPAVAVHSLMLAFVGAAALALWLWLAHAPFFTLLGLHGEASNQAAEYLNKWLFGSVFLVTNMTACALLRASNHSRKAAVGMTVGACLNVLLAPLLIHGASALPALGLPGAALAQTTGSMATTLTLLLLSIKQLRRVQLTHALRGMPEVYHGVLRVAVPATLANGMVPFSTFFVVRLLSAYNDHYVAAYGMAMRMEALCLTGFYAYSSVAGPLLGERIFRQAPSQLVEHLQACRSLCLSRGIIIALALLPLPLTFPFWLTACYEVLPALTQYFWLVPVSYGAYGLVMISNAAFNGIGAPLLGLSVSFMRCLGLPLAWLLGENVGPSGIFISISLSNGLAAMVAYCLLSRTVQSGAKPALNII